MARRYTSRAVLAAQLRRARAELAFWRDIEFGSLQINGVVAADDPEREKLDDMDNLLAGIDAALAGLPKEAAG